MPISPKHRKLRPEKLVTRNQDGAGVSVNYGKHGIGFGWFIRAIRNRRKPKAKP